MNKDKTLYDENSIESLNPRDFTRLKPGVYAGDTEYATQLLVEILSNAVDEYRLGHGNKIFVTIDKDVVSVQDFGQGFIPNSFREDGKTILEAAFSVLNTSGKYREDGTYEGTSLGSFGIGSKITTFLSHWLTVKTWRDNQYEFISFKEGIFDGRTIGEDIHTSGTEVTWQASEEFFTHPEVEINQIKTLFATITCLCPGLTITLTENGKHSVYHSNKGINDLVDKAVNDTELISNRMMMNFVDGKNKMDLVLTYTTNYSLTVIPYVNTGLTESGQHITQVKTTITREFNKFFKSKGWIKDKEDNLTGDDIQEGMYIVFNITAPNVAYDAQVKSRITKIDMTPFTAALAENLDAWLSSNEKEIKAIFDKAAAAKKAREAAKKARERVREGEKKKKKALKFDSKLADCYSKDRSKCEIYIVEGDSAAGNLKTARNNEFQAVMPVRGKVLNTQKAKIEKIQGNAEIMTMIDAFGLEIDMKSLKVVFDKNKLRYGKIIIMSDADVDGSHIKNLFYTFIWNCCPELIENGYIYAGIPPLYRITEGKDKYIYLKDDEALEEYKKSHSNKKYDVSRLKGLGEMSIEDTESTLVNPEQRNLRQVVISDIEATDQLFDNLMGTRVTPRKEFIVAHSEEAVNFE